MLQIALHRILFILTLVIVPSLCWSQNSVQPDTFSVKTDSLHFNLKPDSLKVDSVKLKSRKKSEFNKPLQYASTDSMSYSVLEKKTYLYGEAKVNYDDIEVNAAYIDYNFTTNHIFTKGVPDSAGVLKGRSQFKQKDQDFTTDSMEYNFKTQRGRTFMTNTKQGDGFMISDVTKKQKDGSFHVEGGRYTTCDAPHPHFYLDLSKAIILPNNKIVSGPAHFVMEDVHIYPLFIPFGFFPNKKKNTSGIIIPTYGENVSRGFFLENGGYYFAINQYMDLKLTGTLYSRGTWGFNAATNYYKRYKFGGGLTFNYREEKTGEEGYDLTKTKLISLTWNHRQDQKANPSQSFSASVNYSSSQYDKAFNYFNRNDLISNQKSSSISYSKSWTNMNLTASLRHSQVSSTKDVSFTLPSVNFSVNRFYPFRGKSTTGDYKWYENIALSYTSSMENNIKAKEDDLFTRKTLNTMQNGFQHRIPFNVNFKFLKFFNFTPGLNYDGKLYTTQVMKRQDSAVSYVNGQAVTNYFERVDTIHKISYAHGFTPGASLSFNPIFYGMASFGKNSKIQQIRHVLTPTVSLSMTPDIKSLVPNYYRYYWRKNPKTKDSTRVRYSIYDGNIYGTPSLPVRSGSLSFGLNNNLEMKVLSAKDTVTGVKKIRLIETLNFSSGYNLYAESYKLSPISFSGTTALYKELRVNFNGSIDPYSLDSLGYRQDRYYWKDHKGIGRLTNAGLSFGYQFQSGKGKKNSDAANTKGQGQTEGEGDIKESPKKPAEDYAYFDVPWSLSFNYSLNYSKPGLHSEIIQSLSFSGNISLTKKWQIGFNSGYDFRAKEFAYTTFNITRNLHCWNMTIDFAPFGPYRFYSFRIAAISQLLQDLKYDTRKDYYDYNRNY